MSSLNRATLIGRVGKDPEIRAMQSGDRIANLSLATSEKWKDKQTGQTNEKTEWHRVVVFSQPLVSLVESYIKKGSLLFVEGKIQTRKWMDQNGVEKYSTEIVLNGFDSKITMLGSKADSQSSQRQDVGGTYNQNNLCSVQSQPSFDGSDLDDDIPF